MITDYEKDVSIEALVQAMQMYYEMKKFRFYLYYGSQEETKEKLIEQIKQSNKYEIFDSDIDYIDFMESTGNEEEDDLEGCLFTFSYDRDWRISDCITLFFKGDDWQWDTDIATISELLCKKLLDK